MWGEQQAGGFHETPRKPSFMMWQVFGDDDKCVKNPENSESVEVFPQESCGVDTPPS